MDLAQVLDGLGARKSRLSDLGLPGAATTAGLALTDGDGLIRWAELTRGRLPGGRFPPSLVRPAGVDLRPLIDLARPVEEIWVTEGVAPDGALKLRLADGTLRLISAGDVFFGEAA